MGRLGRLLRAQAASPRMTHSTPALAFQPGLTMGALVCRSARAILNHPTLAMDEASVRRLVTEFWSSEAGVKVIGSKKEPKLSKDGLAALTVLTNAYIQEVAERATEAAAEGSSKSGSKVLSAEHVRAVTTGLLLDFR